MLALQIRATGYPEPTRQHKFLAGRQFKADFCWEKHRIILEVDGGIHRNGRHTRGYGYQKDRERDILALMAGWLTVRVTPDMVKSGQALEIVRSLLDVVGPAWVRGGLYERNANAMRTHTEVDA